MPILPLETEKNVSGVAALAMLEAYERDFEAITFGFEIEIYKHIKAGSGIGSSAASSAGAVFGINELLGKTIFSQRFGSICYARREISQRKRSR